MLYSRKSGMIRTRKLIKRSQKRGLPALLLVLALVAVVASILMTQSPENKAEARYTCPAGQVLRGQRLSSGGYRVYCVATTTTRPTTTTTTTRRPSSCRAGYYRWSFGSRGGCAPCPSTSRTIPSGCSGYTTRPTTTTRPPTTTTTTRPRPSSCRAGYYRCTSEAEEDAPHAHPHP